MKRVNYFLLSLIVVIIASCDSDHPVANQSSQLHVANGRLVFESTDHFSKVLLEITSGKVKVQNGKLAALEYQSYFNSDGKSRQHESVKSSLDLYEFQILLDKNGEAQVGKKIFRVTDSETLIFDLEGNETGKIKNEIQYFDRTENEFVSVERDLTAKSFNTSYYEYLPALIGYPNPYIKYRFGRNQSIVITYIYYAQFYTGTTSVLTNLESWNRVLTDCLCQQQPSNPTGGTINNTSSVWYVCGTSSASYEANYGVDLRAVYYAKQYTQSPVYVYHTLH